MMQYRHAVFSDMQIKFNHVCAMLGSFFQRLYGILRGQATGAAVSDDLHNSDSVQYLQRIKGVTMPDFNQVLDPGDYQNGILNTVVEIPEGSFLKVEWDRKRAAFMLDRVEPSIYKKPCNY